MPASCAKSRALLAPLGFRGRRARRTRRRRGRRAASNIRRERAWRRRVTPRRAQRAAGAGRRLRLCVVPSAAHRASARRALRAPVPRSRQQRGAAAPTRRRHAAAGRITPACSWLSVSTEDPEPLIADARWYGEICASAARRGRLRLRPAVLCFRPSACTAAELDPEEKNRISHRGLH